MRVPMKLRFFFCFFFAVTAAVVLLSSTQSAALSVESRNATLSCDGRGWSEECLITGENEDGIALDPYPDLKATDFSSVTVPTGTGSRPVVDNCIRRPNTGCLQEQKNKIPPPEKCQTIYGPTQNRGCGKPG